MSPERQTTVNGHQITEYYWAGVMVVYVDHKLTKESYEQAIARLEDSNP